MHAPCKTPAGCFLGHMPEVLTTFTSRLDFAGMQTLLAQAGGASNPWGDFEFWKFIGGLIAVLAILNYTVAIYNGTKRQPRIEDHYATKKELADGLVGVRAAGETRRNEIMEEIEQQTASLTQQLSHLELRTSRDLTSVVKSQAEQNAMLLAIQRSLGRLEGSGH